MKVIPPVKITSARIISSTVPLLNTNSAFGEVEQQWLSGTGYGVDDMRVDDGRRYRCRVAVTGSIKPIDDPEHWKDIGPSNYMAMFDMHRNSKTVAASPMTVVLQPGQRIDSLALGGLQANLVEVTMHVGGAEVFSKSYNLSSRRTKSWSEYRFGKFTTKKSIIDFSLPRYSSAQITITISSPTGVVRCGAAVVGSSVYLGDMQSGDGSTLNFSLIERNGFGDAVLNPRPGVPKVNVSLLTPANATKNILDVKENLNAVPAVWCGIEKASSGLFELFLIFGIWKKFDPSTTKSAIEIRLNLELEEI